MKSVILVLSAAAILCVNPHSAAAQSMAGADVFTRACATCHDDRPTSRAPSLDALRTRSTQAILDALLTGAMRMQGARLTGAERRAVAEFASGKTAPASGTETAAGRCQPAAFRIDPSRTAWNGWSPTLANTHAQSAAAAGLNASNVPKLTLKWAFGFPESSVAFSQPSVVGGRLFVGSHSGAVYALDAKSGCTYWSFQAHAAVRTAPIVAPRADGDGTAVFVGDLAGYLYALNAESGAEIWSRQIDAHPFARITGSPALYRNRLYVPMSSLEESMARNGDYGCCTFRGSVIAVDIETGKTVWQTFTLPDVPSARGKNKDGVTLFGPSGVPVWTTPTIDERRQRIYISTGNMYTGPQQKTSDGVMALDLASGRVVWTQQMTPADIFPCPKTGPNCLEEGDGPDFDFGNAPILAPLGNGRDLLVLGQKSGIGWALDPDKDGAIVWQYRAAAGGTLGGMEWGSSVDDEHAYFPVSDIQRDAPGGLHAVDLRTGTRSWIAPPPTPLCGTERNCNSAQSAAITVIPGVIFSGSNDGGLRAYSTRDGQVLWTFDTNRTFATVNGVTARGASIIGPGPTIVDGMVYTNSGYGQYGGRPGNVLLAFGVE